MAALQRIAASGAFAAVRRAPSVLIAARRGYAEPAAPAGDKLHLSLVLPHEVCSLRFNLDTSERWFFPAGCNPPFF